MKKVNIISFFLFIILSSSFAFAQVQIQSNNFSADGSTIQGYTLDKTSGDRSITIVVTFDKPFTNKPAVVLSVTKLDADTKSDVRYNVEATAVTKEGFVLKISTWSESKILGISGSWIAYSN
jgi:hypothetical protein